MTHGVGTGAVDGAVGVRNIQHDFYPGGRHEMLNEINRDEVRAKLLEWIRSSFGFMKKVQQTPLVRVSSYM
jgi:hypothetical protein